MDTIRETVVNEQLSTPASEVIEKPEPVRNLAYYNKIITPHLKPEFFERNPLRLLYLTTFTLGNLGLLFLAMSTEMHWLGKLIVGIVIGFFNAGLAFFSHELSHGSVIKNKHIQDFIGFFSFAPFLMSPTYWRFCIIDCTMEIHSLF